MSDIEHWENRYIQGNIPWDTGHPSAELMRVLDEEKIARCPAIDLGCGTGSNTIYLAEQGFEVTGVDLSHTAIERAQSKQANAAVNARFVQGDVLNLPEDIGGPFGFVFDQGCYHIVRLIDVDRYLQTLERITAAGSLGLILTGNAKEKAEIGPPVVSEEEIRAEIGKLFQIVRLREFRFDPIKGPEDKPLGWSCLVRRK
jgi:2-polyprenyl-3-methyl-5-hydroxy-6-metoxy-1,4-benzoquinol methylase